MQQLPSLPSPWWALSLVPLGIAARYRPSGLVPFFFVTGIAWAAFRAGIILGDALPPELEGKNVLIEGYIADIPEQADYGLRFVFDVDRAEYDGRPVHVPRRVQLAFGRRARASGPREDTFHVGERWRLLVRLKRPHGFQNPGGFDYEGYLFRHRIRARGYVRREVPPKRLEPGSPGIGSGMNYATGRIRQAVGGRIHALLPDNAFAGVITALANGDKHGITDAQWSVLRRTGTLHLVAISGLHISLIAGVVFFLVRSLWAMAGTTVLRAPAPVVGAIGALVAAAAYAALAGFTIPTQRALIMTAVAMGSILVRRRFRPSLLLAVALFLVLLHDPLAVMASGFWLSFAAVGVIIFAVHGEVRLRPLWRKWGSVQWMIAVGTLPLMLWLFRQVSLVAPLANMLAVPAFDLLVVPLTLGGVVAQAILPDSLATPIFQGAAWLLQSLWPALALMSGFGYGQWTQHQPIWWTLPLAVVGVAILLAPRGWPARWLGAVWLLPLFLVRPMGPVAGEVWFALLDVGQGLAAVVRTRSHVLVYDTGPRFSPRFDTGAAVVVPYLEAQGIRRIDTLMISHGDRDHVGGMESILSALPVGDILTNVALSRARVDPCTAGRRWRWDDVEFVILSPVRTGFSRRNNDSCVLRVSSPYGSVLLPGDIEAGAEDRLVEREGTRLSADILVAPHHGSKTSSTSEFIAKVSPAHVLFPAGYRNRYHHPDAGVVGRYLAHGSKLHDSASDGAIEVFLRVHGAQIASFRKAHRRYWFSE